MIFKLPKERNGLSKEITDKVHKLKPPKDAEWFRKFEDCSINKDLYEHLIHSIRHGGVKPDELNDTISNKKDLENRIAQQENDLLQLINDPIDMSDIDKVIEKIQRIARQGTISIRPPKGNYAKPKGRP